MIRHAALLILALVFAAAGSPVLAETKLRVFSGGAQQRPDLMRRLFDDYSKRNPGISIDIETGGSTSELQRQYLSTVLNAKDASVDIYLIDIVNPAQYYGAGWLEPLNAYVGDPAAAMKPYLPVYASSNVVDGKVAAMPAFADAMFMYYRRDLLDKHRDEFARAESLDTGKRYVESQYDLDDVIATLLDLKAARLAAEEAAAQFGFSLSEITGSGDGRRKYTRRAGIASAGAAKYRNPDDARQTWTGKGRQPAWFKAALEKGTDPSDMEI